MITVLKKRTCGYDSVAYRLTLVYRSILTNITQTKFLAHINRSAFMINASLVEKLLLYRTSAITKC